MADKAKRLRKALFNAGLKGKLKTVKTLEEAYIVIVLHPHDSRNCFVYHKDRYQEELNSGKTFWRNTFILWYPPILEILNR